MPETKQTNTVNGRTTVAVLRGLPSYKKELKRKIESISKKSGRRVKLEHLIELGINLALTEHGEAPMASSRILGRYAEKS